MNIFSTRHLKILIMINSKLLSEYPYIRSIFGSGSVDFFILENSCVILNCIVICLTVYTECIIKAIKKGKLQSHPKTCLSSFALFHSFVSETTAKPKSYRRVESK